MFEARIVDMSLGLGVHEHVDLMTVGLQGDAHGNERVDVSGASCCSQKNPHWFCSSVPC